MVKHIKVEATPNKVNDFQTVTVKIIEQSHRGSNFGDTSSVFTHNGCTLQSWMLPDNGLGGCVYVRGCSGHRDLDTFELPAAKYKKFKEAVVAYNEFFKEQPKSVEPAVKRYAQRIITDNGRNFAQVGDVCEIISIDDLYVNVWSKGKKENWRHGYSLLLPVGYIPSAPAVATQRFASGGFVPPVASTPVKRYVERINCDNGQGVNQEAKIGDIRELVKEVGSGYYVKSSFGSGVDQLWFKGNSRLLPLGYVPMVKVKASSPCTEIVG